MYGQVQVSATGRSLVQWGSTECGVSECDLETLTRRKPGPSRLADHEKRKVAANNYLRLGKNVVLCWLFRESMQTVHRTLVFLVVLRCSDR